MRISDWSSDVCSSDLMRKADIRRGHKGNERISDMLEELHRTLFAVDDKSWRGKKATLRFSLISSSREEAEDEEGADAGWIERSEEHTSELQSLMRISYADLCLKQKKHTHKEERQMMK